MGRRHCRNLLQLGVKDLVFYRSHMGSLEDTEFSSHPQEEDLNVAFSHQPDAVVVANPTALHIEIAIEAAKRGCHLFLEKPVSHNLEGVDELLKVVKENQVKVEVGFQYRFHPLLIQAREKVNQGEIGKVLSFRVQYDEHLAEIHPWEDYRNSYAARKDLGGGPILTFCHPLDYMPWILGDVEKLWAFCSTNDSLESTTEDAAEIGLKLSSGAIGSLHLGYNRRPSRHGFEVIGTKGSITWEDSILRQFSPESNSWKEYSVPEGYQRNSMFVEEMANFLQVVEENSTPVCGLRDGLSSLRLCMAAHESSEKGCMVSV